MLGERRRLRSLGAFAESSEGACRCHLGAQGSEHPGCRLHDGPRTPLLDVGHRLADELPFWQPHIPGTAEHQWSVHRRSNVESAFSRIKDTAMQSVMRGDFRVMGIAKVTIAILLSAMAANLAEVTRWRDRQTGVTTLDAARPVKTRKPRRLTLKRRQDAQRRAESRARREAASAEAEPPDGDEPPSAQPPAPPPTPKTRPRPRHARIGSSAGSNALRSGRMRVARRATAQPARKAGPRMHKARPGSLRGGQWCRLRQPKG